MTALRAVYSGLVHIIFVILSPGEGSIWRTGWGDSNQLDLVFRFHVEVIMDSSPSSSSRQSVAISILNKDDTVSSQDTVSLNYSPFPAIFLHHFSIL
jgi:hypothetical protein